LPNRKNIVVSSSMNEQDGIKIFNNLNDAIAFSKKYNEENDIDEIILIGGAKVFAEGLKQTTKLVISWVDANSIKGDVYFPEFNKQEWREVDSKKFFKSEKNQYDFEIKEYLRK
jgi:dihydrofolate reductase